MAHPRVYEKLKPVLLSFDFLEEAKEEDIKGFIKLKEDYELVMKRLEEHEITKHIINSKNIGIVIYQDKISFVNEYAKNLLGYTDEELSKMHISDLVTDEYKEVVKTIAARRFKGEAFNTSYLELKAITKSKKTMTVYVFSSTIAFKGEPSGFVVFFDITKRKRFENMYAILREVNQAITSSAFEEELFNRISKTLIDKFSLKLVWIGEVYEKSDYFKIPYKFGDSIESLSKVKVSYKENLKEGLGPSGRAVREDRIIIEPNTQEDPNFTPWKDVAKEYGLMSLASIPIKVEGKPKYVMAMYSGEPEFFNEDVIDVLKEIKSDIEFALKRMTETRESIIIKKAIESSPSWMLVTDENFKIVYVNDAVSNISLYEKEELIGKNPNIFKSGIQPDEFYKEFYKEILKGESFYAVFVNKKKNGELFYLNTAIYPLEIAPGVKRYVAIGKDITKETELTNKVVKLKNYDVLTGLLNLEGFTSEVSFHLKEGNISFLALVDIWSFTNINKIYGIEIGDKVLKEISNRLKRDCEGAILSRISSDEFGIFRTGFKDESEMLLYSTKMKDIFSKPITLDDKEIYISFDIGLSFYPKDGDNFKALYENASISLRYAKQRGENTIIYFNQDIEKQVEHINFIQELIEKALKDNLFVLYYQPFFDIKNLKIAGFEALIRIKDEDGTIYTPNIFIDFLERSKHIFDFEKWLLDKISQKSTEWKLPISFNISARSFSNDEHIEKVASLNVDAIMEITERILLENPEKVKHILEHIKEESALKIAIDDFGTEYSSLKYIKNLPIDEIKIDISFVRSMMQNKKDMALVKAIINLSKDLGFKTLAEGVETQGQLQALKDMGCDYVQGFLLGKPMPEEEAKKLIT